MSEDNNDFTEYRRLILAELERLNRDVEALSKAHHGILSELKIIKLKIAAAATVAGLLASAAYKWVVQ